MHDGAAVSAGRLAPPVVLLQPARLRHLGALAVADWAGLVACWLAMAAAPPLLLPPLVVLAASRLHALGALLHDVANLPRSRIRRAYWLTVLLGWPLGTTAAHMRYHHLRHHRHNGRAEDPYFVPDVDRRPGRAALALSLETFLLPMWWLTQPLLALALLWPRLRTPVGRWLLLDRSRRDLTHSAELLEVARAGLPLAAFAALVVVPLALAAPRAFLLGYGAPALLAGTLSGLRLIREHRYRAVPDNSPQSILLSTRNQGTGGGLAALGGFFLAPHNIGYHVVHHLHPQAGFAQLPDLQRFYDAHAAPP